MRWGPMRWILQMFDWERPHEDAENHDALIVSRTARQVYEQQLDRVETQLRSQQSPVTSEQPSRQ